MASETALRTIVQDELAASLRITKQELDLDQSFLYNGGDSLSAILFMSKCRLHGIKIDIKDILKYKSASALVEGVISSQTSQIRLNTTTDNRSDNAILRASTQTPVDRRLKDFVDSGRHVQSIGPCSSMQNRILISQAVNPAAYQCRFVLKATAEAPRTFTTSAVNELWNQVVARHHSLRTTFLDSEERLSTFDQVVWANAEQNVTLLQAEDYIYSDDMVPLNTKIFPHHLYIYQKSLNEVLLRLDISHAVIDGESAGVLLQDLYAAYLGRLSVETTMPHAEYARLEEQIQEGAQEYWAKYLEDAEETYLPSAVGNEGRAGIYTLQDKVDFPADKARQFCDNHGVTLVNICQLAWGMTLRFFALKEDITFSYVTSGRQSELAGMHEAVGLFVSGLVMRMNFSENPTVIDMLKGATEDVLQGMTFDRVPPAHQTGSDYPISRKWGNSILSFGRDWESLTPTTHDLKMSVLKRSSPTDVGDDLRRIETEQCTDNKLLV